MKIFFVTFFMLINLISLGCASDSEDENSNDFTKIEEDASSFIFSNVEDLFVNETILNNNQNNQFFDNNYFLLFNQSDLLDIKINSSDIVIDDSITAYDLAINDSILAYTSDEIEFLNSFEEKTKNSVSYQDICVVFKECLQDDFSSYLSLKKKLLYIDRFLASSFTELKNKIQLEENFSCPNDHEGWVDYFLDFIFTKITNASKIKTLNLEQYNPADSGDREIFLYQLQDCHPSAFFLCDLLAHCPTEIFMQNEDDLKVSYPHFYDAYQTTKQNTAQKIPPIKKPFRNILYKNMDDLLQYTQQLMKDIHHDSLKSFTKKDWEEKTHELKKLWDPAAERSIATLKDALYRLSKKIDDSSLKTCLLNFRKAAQRLYQLERQNNDLSDAQITLAQHVQQLIKDIPTDSLKSFSNKDWEEKTHEMKKLWDPHTKKSMGTLWFELCQFFKKVDDPILKTTLLKFTNAARRLYQREKYNNEVSNTQQNNDLSDAQKTLAQHVQQLMKGIPLDSLKKFTNKDWEEKILELKELWDPQTEKSIGTLSTALYKLSKKVGDPDLKTTLLNLSNAARRLNEQNQQNNDLSDAQKTLAQHVQHLMKDIPPDSIKSFAKKDWEEKAQELKNVWDPQAEKTSGTLSDALYKLWKKVDNPNLKDTLLNLSKAARRLNEQNQQNKDLSDAQKTLAQHVQQLMKDIPPDSLTSFEKKDCEEKILELKKLWDPQAEKSSITLSDALYKLSRQVNDPILKTTLLNLSNAALKLHKQEKKNKEVSNTQQNKDLLDAQKTLVQHVQHLMKDIPTDSLKSFTNKNWEEKILELKKLWDPQTEKSIRTLSTALYNLSRKVDDPNLKTTLTNFSRAARRLNEQNQQNNDLSDAQKTLAQHVQQLMKDIPPDSLKNFSNKDWEEKAQELKNVWDPQAEKSNRTLSDALYKLWKKVDNPSLKDTLLNLSRAARRLNEQNQQNKDLSDAQKTLAQHVQHLMKDIPPDTLKSFSNKDWEEKILELKKLWDPQAEKNIGTLSLALYKFSKKIDNPSLNNTLLNFSNAARRIKDRKATKKSIETKEDSIKKSENSALGKRVKNQSNKQIKKKKNLNNTSIEKDERIDSDFTINQNQEKENAKTPNLNVIFDNVEPSKPSSLCPPITNNNELNNPDLTSHQILEDLDNIMTPVFDLPIPQNNLLLTNNSSFNNEKEILIKIKKYIRPTYFDIHSSLHQIVATKGFFTVAEKQIFDLVESPRILMMLSDVFEINSFSFQDKKRAVEIIFMFLEKFHAE